MIGWHQVSFISLRSNIYFNVPLFTLFCRGTLLKIKLLIFKFARKEFGFAWRRCWLAVIGRGPSSEFLCESFNLQTTRCLLPAVGFLQWWRSEVQFSHSSAGHWPLWFILHSLYHLQPCWFAMSLCKTQLLFYLLKQQQKIIQSKSWKHQLYIFFCIDLLKIARCTVWWLNQSDSVWKTTRVHKTCKFIEAIFFVFLSQLHQESVAKQQVG